MHTVLFKYTAKITVYIRAHLDSRLPNFDHFLIVEVTIEVLSCGEL